MIKNNFYKRTLAGILSAAMLITSVPVSAFGESIKDTEETQKASVQNLSAEGDEADPAGETAAATAAAAAPETAAATSAPPETAAPEPAETTADTNAPTGNENNTSAGEDNEGTTGGGTGTSESGDHPGNETTESNAADNGTTDYGTPDSGGEGAPSSGETNENETNERETNENETNESETNENETNGSETEPAADDTQDETQPETQPETSEESLITLSGMIAYMEEESSSRPVPELHLYANGTEINASAEFVDSATPYLGTYDARTWTYQDLPEKDEDGNAVSYTLLNANDGASSNYELYYLNAEDTALEYNKDENGQYPAEKIILVYTANGVLHGTFETDDPALDLTGFTLNCTADDMGPASDKLTDRSVSISRNEGEAMGTWQTANVPLYHPGRGKIEYKITAAENPNGYAVYYDNSAVSGHETETDCAYVGGAVQVAGNQADLNVLDEVNESNAVLIYQNRNENGSGSAGLKNTYGKVLGFVKLKKVWNTKYNVSNLPSAVVLTLFRKCKSGSKEKVGTYTIGATDGWEKTIDGLEIYAPNGEVYSYTVEEVDENGLPTVPEGYTAVSSQGVAANAEEAAAASAAVTNTPEMTDVSFTKTLVYNGLLGTDTVSEAAPFGQSILGVPVSMEFHIAYSIDDGKTWKRLLTTGNQPVTLTRTVNSDGTIGDAANYKLPASTLDQGVLKTVTYRVYEYSVTYDADEDGKQHTYTRSTEPGDQNFADYDFSRSEIGSLVSTQTGGANTDTIVNTVEMIPITITKVWDDENNRDGIRPDSLEFAVLRDKINALDDRQVATVTLSKENAVGEDGTAGQNIWSKTIYVPVYWNVNQTVKSTYCIREKLDDNPAYTIYSSNTMQQVTDAADTGWAEDIKIVEMMENRNYANFKNTHKNGNQKISITAAKEWKYGDTTYAGITQLPAWLQSYLPKNITFQLQYRINGTDSWNEITEEITSDATHDLSGIPGTRTAEVNPTTGAVKDATWTDLPRHAATTDLSEQHTYCYRVVEVQDSPQSDTFTASAPEVDGVLAGDVTTVTTTNTLNTASLSIAKTWNDGENQYDTRPDSITYKLEYSTDGSNWSELPDDWAAAKTVTASASESYGVTVKNLPSYNDENPAVPYQYRAAEQSLNYGTGASVVKVAPGESAIYKVSTADHKTFTNTLNDTSVTVNKTWEDASNCYGLRPQSITFKVQQKAGDSGTYTDYKPNNTLVTFTAAVNPDGTLTENTLSGLPGRNPDGTENAYRAVEASFTYTDPVTGDQKVARTGDRIGAYDTQESTAKSAEEGYITSITNTLATRDLSVTKAWVDQNNSRPESIQVSLVYTEGILLPAVQASVTLSSTNGWSASWTGLPLRDKEGNSITYTVKEDIQNGYTSPVYTGNAADGFTVTNTANAFTIRKTDGTNALSGAEFTVTPKAPGTFADGTTAAKSMLGTKNGTALSEDTLSGQLVAGITYTIRETKIPAGYQKVDDFTVTMNADGTVTLEDPPVGVTLDQDGHTVIAADTRTSISICKTGLNHAWLAGAVFELTGTFAQNQTGKITWTSQDGTNGTKTAYVITGELIAGNVYKLTESIPTPGYTAVSDIYLKIDDQGQLFCSDSAGGQFAKITDNAVIVTDVQTDLLIQKMDDKTTAEPADGAQLTLTRTDGTKKLADGTASYVWTTDSAKDSLIEVQGLLVVGGDYQIEETGVPYGYLKADTVTFHVEMNGTISNLDGAALSVQPGSGKQLLTMTDPIGTAEITLTKTDDNKTKGNPLQSVTFELYRTTDLVTGDDLGEGSEVQIPVTKNSDGTYAYAPEGTEAGLVTDAAGQIKVTGLPEGGYYFTETEVMDTFVLNKEKQYFTVARSADSNIMEVHAGQNGEGEVTAGLTMVNEAVDGRVLIQKTDATSGAGLNEAEFTLYRAVKEADGSYTAVTDPDESGRFPMTLASSKSGTVYNWTDASGNAQSYTAAADGTVFAGGLDKGDYLLKETKAPVSYQLNTEWSYGFTVTGEKAAQRYTPENTAENTRILGTVTLRKADRENQSILLSNAEFTLYKLNEENQAYEKLTTGLTGMTYTRNAAAGGSVSWQAKTGAAGDLIFSNLEWGSYRLEETRPAPGYTSILEGSSLKQFGFAIEQGGLERYFTADEFGVITNDKSVVSLKKVDLNGAPLSGAEFTLTGVFADSRDMAEAETRSWMPGSENAWKGKLVEGNTYVLKETKAPAGYELAEDVIFTVNLGGTISIDESCSAYAKLDEAEKNQILVSDAPIEVMIRKVDADTAAALEGMQISLTGRFAEAPDQEQTKALIISAEGLVLDGSKTPGLIGGQSYLLAETAAPGGYAFLSGAVRFTVDTHGILTADATQNANGAATASADGLTLTLADTKTEVTVAKQDTSGAQTAGARMVIKDASGTVVSAFTTGAAPEVLNGVLNAGETYILSELEAPKGYHVAADVTFIVPADGVASVSMTDERIVTQTETGSIQVTKVVTYQNMPLSVNHTFYAALFEDEALTKRISDVKAIELKGTYAGRVTFENLALNRTYYAAETDEYGTVVTTDEYFDSTVSNSKLTLSITGHSGSALINNQMKEMPPYNYEGQPGMITVTKKLVKDGRAAEGEDEIFFVTLFADEDFQIPVSETKLLNMNGVSSVSVTFTELPAGVYYIMETDANGTPVDDSLEDFGYKLTRQDEYIQVEEDRSYTTTLTNESTAETETEIETEIETETETEKETEVKSSNTGGGSKANSAKTGDETPVAPMTGVLGISMLAIILLMYRRRRREEEAGK
ncbi:MAG: SpaA isopeptide-forming pilin-related protein [Lachnospiraceae bacterium]|nr:SpaA isopeptide-forming pilin-related protein [Lachnospiraceae bacterium]